MKLHVVIASTRPGRLGAQVGQWFAGLAETHGSFDMRIVDLAEVDLPFLDEPAQASTGTYVHEHTRAWSALVNEADAFTFVMPEYNAGINAPLKNALDFLYNEWAYKPVGFVSYGGVAAGTRAVQMAKQVVATLQMYPLKAAVAIPTRQYIDADGVLRADAALHAAATSLLDELARVATALEQLRKERSAV